MKSRRARALGWAGAAVIAGLIWRLAPLHLPGFAYKYGGSALYAAMLYWLLAAAMPRAPVRVVACWSTLLAFAVEAFKRVHRPALDAFRITLAGKLLLGRVFTWGALVAYLFAIAVVAVLENATRPGAPPSRS